MRDDFRYRMSVYWDSEKNEMFAIQCIYDMYLQYKHLEWMGNL